MPLIPRARVQEREHGKTDLEKGKRDTERNIKRGRRGGGRNQEDREEMWGPPGCWPCPLSRGQGFLSYSSLPHVISRESEEFCFRPLPPNSCHGDGNPDPVESSLCLAMRLQHPASCLPACAWAASSDCCQESRPALPLHGGPALSALSLGRRP